MDVQSVKLLNLDLKTCDKDVFMEQQTAQGAKANVQFDESIRAVVNDVQTVIQQVNNMYTNSKVDPASNTMTHLIFPKATC